jgi:Carboxypeptidase regulatory-like domain/TonB dependent receptor-like, beta-barrel
MSFLDCVHEITITRYKVRRAIQTHGRLAGIFLLVFVAVAATSQAQITTSSITGFVTDASGALVPQAQIMIKQQETGFSRTTTTSAGGQYLISAIPSGTYRISVQKSGFKTAERTGVGITPQFAARIDFVLEVGESRQTITVQGQSPILNTETATNAVTLSSSTISALPTLGRSYLQTAILSPGVLPTAPSSLLVSTEGGVQTGAAAYKAVSVDISGGMPDLTGFIQDGFDVREPLYGGDIYQLSTEAISSVRIVRGYDTAQYGGEPSVVYVTTKSGTNDYHGSAFEFHQDAAMLARTVPSAIVPPLTYNQGGFTFGGPALPRLRDKTFVFGAFQFTRMRSSNVINGIVPTAAEWNGDLSSSPRQLYNPFSVDTLNNTRQPFQGNIIPPELLSPFAQAFKQFVPLPTNPNAPYGQLNLTTLGTQLNDDTQYLIRVDQMLPSGGKLFVKYFRDKVNAISYGLSEFAGLALPDKGQTASAEWDQPMGGNKVSQLRIGFYRSVTDYGAIFTSQDLAGSVLGLKNVAHQFFGLPSLSVTGFSVPSSLASDLHRITTRVGISEDFAYITGPHSLNLGFLFEPIQSPDYTTSFARGQIGYTGAFSSLRPGGSGGSALADFLLGTFASGTANAAGFNPLMSTKYWSCYAQDQYKISRKLTLTAGVRWDYLQPPVERHNRLVAFDQEAGKIVYVLKDPLNFMTDDTTLSGDVPRGLFVNYPKTNFSPRVGFAYLIEPNTTIRAGGGIYYAQGMAWFQLFPPGHGGPPFSNNVTVTNDTSQLTPSVLDTQLFPAASITTLTPGTIFNTNDIHAAPTYVEQATFSIEHQFGNNVLVSAAYNGMFGHHLMAAYNTNQAVPFDPNNPLPLAQRRPYPFFSDMLLRSNSGNSAYNGLSLYFEKRYSHGLSLTSSYTWSKSLDIYSSDGAGFQNQNANCRRCDRSPSSYDRRNSFSIGYIWELPFGPQQRWLSQGAISKVVGRWRFSGITQFMSGLPLTMTMPSSWPNIAAAYTQARPDRVCSGKLQNPTMAEFFDTSCFVDPAANSFGNSARNVIGGPGAQFWNMSLARQFSFLERFKLDFRADLFSVFNHQNWGSPNTSVVSPSFGEIFGKSDPRRIQLGLKLEF